MIDPAGNVIGEPLIDDEGIVYADIDLNKCVAPKQMHDIIYKKFLVSVPLIGISFVEYHQGKACELLYFSLIMEKTCIEMWKFS